MTRLLPVLAAALLLAACAKDHGPKRSLGTLLGGIGGAVAGSQIGRGSGRHVAIAAGALFGAVLGNEIGRSLDEADRLAAEHAAQNALESHKTGQPAEWSNPDSGNSGWVVPTKTWREPAGNYCREYQTGVTIGGKEETAYGTACRQPDGSWQIVS